jgi:hypothetical protein
VTTTGNTFSARYPGVALPDLSGAFNNIANMPAPAVESDLGTTQVRLHSRPSWPARASGDSGETVRCGSR